MPAGRRDPSSNPVPTCCEAPPATSLEGMSRVSDSNNSTYTLVPPHVPSCAHSCAIPLSARSGPVENQKDGTPKVDCTGFLQWVSHQRRAKSRVHRPFSARNYPAFCHNLKKVLPLQGSPRTLRCKN